MQKVSRLVLPTHPSGIRYGHTQCAEPMFQPFAAQPATQHTYFSHFHIHTVPPNRTKRPPNVCSPPTASFSKSKRWRRTLTSKGLHSRTTPYVTSWLGAYAL